MTHGRIETTPEQQLAELRVAYARYATLAERWREESSIDPDERQAREQDARRIAHAYEKTIASTALRLESMHRTHAEALGFTPLAKALSVMLGVAVLAGGAATVYLRPELFGDVLPRGLAGGPAREVAVNAPIAKPIIAPMMTQAAKPAVAPAPKPVIAPAAKPAVTQAATPAKAKPAPSQKQTAPQQTAAAKPVAAKPAPAKAEARTPVKTETRAPALPRVAVTPPVAAPSPQAKLEPLSPPKDVAALPVPPKIDAANSNVVAPPKPMETAATAPQTATAQASASAPAPSGTQSAKLVPVARTHTLPPYPIDAKRAGEQGTTQMEVAISALGVITDCKVITSSGSQRLDATACSFVQHNWRWQPPTRDGREVPATTKVSVIWNLIAGR